MKNKIKRISCCFLMLLFVMVLARPYANVYAEESGESYYIFDYAQLLSDSEWYSMEDKAARIADRTGCEVIVLTVDDFRDYGYSNTEELARDFYKTGLGYTSQSVQILALSMDDRDYTLVSYGTIGDGAFTDDAKDKIEAAFKAEFKDDDWDGGLDVYLEESEYYLNYYSEHGTGYEKPHTFRQALKERPLMAIGIGILAPIILALIICGVIAAGNKNVHSATEASQYLKQDGFKLTAQRDQFMFTTTTRRKIESDNDSSGGGGGSSSAHSGKF